MQYHNLYTEFVMSITFPQHNLVRKCRHYFTKDISCYYIIVRNKYYYIVFVCTCHGNTPISIPHP